ncbi:YopT-type cysteine protease domain-containing protein [Escherichia coli]|uniref:YopT-type cysteine protease domain-containing protein n=1 Tax=Escherichia coli TaxID=562 RepID=UPI00245337AA|nr:YopT-type cysteine protease domain-containing protein [Escherichia coli]
MLSSIRNATAKSAEGTEVKVGNRIYRVVVSDNQFKVSRESHGGCFSRLLERLGWPKGEITRKIEVLLNQFPVNPVNENDASAHKIPPVGHYSPPSIGLLVDKEGNASSILDERMEIKSKTKKDNPNRIDKILKEYCNALMSKGNDFKVKVIRGIDMFFNGYDNAKAKDIVPEFDSKMNMKDIVNILNENKYNCEQIGALSYEVENRALLATFKTKTEEYHNIYNKACSKGQFDPFAKEKLMPQLFFLNLVGDGYGGRCDPLTMLMLAEKHLESTCGIKPSNKLFENMYAATTILNSPELYTNDEVAKSNDLLKTIIKLHKKNPMYNTSEKIWQEKLGEKPINEIGKLLHNMSFNHESVLLKLEAPGHAMAAWAINYDDHKIYGFYDPNGGIVEFSHVSKFDQYFNDIFGEAGLDKASKYHLNKNSKFNDAVFDNIIVLDGNALLRYKTDINGKTLKEILNINIL